MVFHGGVWGKFTFDQKVDSLFAKSEFTFQHENQPKCLNLSGGPPTENSLFHFHFCPSQAPFNEWPYAETCNRVAMLGAPRAVAVSGTAQVG